MPKLHRLPESKFEDEDGLDAGPLVDLDTEVDTEFRDPEYDEEFADPDADDGGSQEWRVRPQR